MRMITPPAWDTTIFLFLFPHSESYTINDLTRLIHLTSFLQPSYVRAVFYGQVYNLWRLTETIGEAGEYEVPKFERFFLVS